VGGWSSVSRRVVHGRVTAKPEEIGRYYEGLVSLAIFPAAVEADFCPPGHPLDSGRGRSRGLGSAQRQEARHQYSRSPLRPVATLGVRPFVCPRYGGLRDLEAAWRAARLDARNSRGSARAAKGSGL